jgi:oligoribonuclease
MWVALDLETTGLNPKKDKILECAVAELEYDDNGYTKEITHHASWVVDHQISHLVMDEYVRGMHTRNSLLQEIELGTHRGKRSGVWDVRDLDLSLCEFVRRATPRSVVLVGNSIHFDRAFLAEHCPMFMSKLSHRMIDVSSLNLLRNTFGELVSSPVSNHRAMDDVLSSVNQLKPYVRMFVDAKKETAK